MASTSPKQSKGLETLVGNTLRYGVWLSFTLTVIGLVVLLIKKGNAALEPEKLPLEPEKFSFQTLFNGILHLDPVQICMLGIFVLLMTPLLRVIFSMFGYLKEGNKLYFGITVLVLALLALSAWIGVSH